MPPIPTASDEPARGSRPAVQASAPDLPSPPDPVGEANSAEAKASKTSVGKQPKTGQSQPQTPPPKASSHSAMAAVWLAADRAGGQEVALESGEAHGGTPDSVPSSNTTSAPRTEPQVPASDTQCHAHARCMHPCMPHCQSDC